MEENTAVFRCNSKDLVLYTEPSGCLFTWTLSFVSYQILRPTHIIFFQPSICVYFQGIRFQNITAVRIAYKEQDAGM